MLFFHLGDFSPRWFYNQERVPLSVLQFHTWEGGKISVRPSGTEPKIKFYISVNLRLSDPGNFEHAMSHLDEKIKAIEKDIVK